MIDLVRRWAVDWLAARDPSVCPEILAPGYALRIGGFELGPRDEYVATTLGQLDRFPGLGVTVHELIASGDRVALRFTEHGASVKLDGRVAAWGGVALFEGDGRRLTRCWAEEDYLSRRRQLESATCDPIEPPAPAPWNVAPLAPDPAAEAVVRDWLERGELGTVDLDDGWLGHEVVAELEGTVEADVLFSAGSRVAFHGAQRGPGPPLHLAGLVRVEDGEVAAGRVVRDRLGLRRAAAAAVNG